MGAMESTDVGAVWASPTVRVHITATRPSAAANTHFIGFLSSPTIPSRISITLRAAWVADRRCLPA
jgi:hypothetical protein